jgi:hypothetical protein
MKEQAPAAPPPQAADVPTPVEIVRPTRQQALRNGWTTDPFSGQRRSPSLGGGDSGFDFARDLMSRAMRA